MAGEATTQDPGHFLELLASSQGRRLDDQRVSLSHFPGLRLSSSSSPPAFSTSVPEQAHAQGDHNTMTSTHQSAAATLFNVDSFQTHPGFTSTAPTSSSVPPPSPSPCIRLDSPAEPPEGEDFFDMLVKCQVTRQGWSGLLCSGPLSGGSSSGRKSGCLVTRRLPV